MPIEQKEPGCPLCQCEHCCKEIPESAAKTVEGADYVRYFCSTECYEKWWSNNRTNADKKDDVR